MVILDQNSIILGSYFKDEKSEELINKVLPYFIKLDNEFQDHINMGNDLKDQIIFQRTNYYFVFKKFSLKSIPFSWYLILLKKGVYFFEDTFEPLIKMLELVIYKEVLNNPYAFNQ